MTKARTLYKEAFAHYVANEIEAAIAGFRRALEADPTLSIAWNGLSMALDKAGDLDAAIDAAKQLIALEPDDVLAHTSLSRLFQRKGMIQEAEEEQLLAARLQQQS